MNQQLLTINKRKGFTLIELLVVMAIIATLAAFSTILFNNAKAKARDAKRKQDMRSLQAALFLYSRDHFGIYPSCPGAFTAGACILNDLRYNPSTDNLVPIYIQQMPIEPGLKSNTSGYGSLTFLRYHYLGTDNAGALECNEYDSCTNFSVTACIENTQDPTATNNTNCGGKAFSLTAPN